MLNKLQMQSCNCILNLHQHPSAEAIQHYEAASAQYCPNFGLNITALLPQQTGFHPRMKGKQQNV